MVSDNPTWQGPSIPVVPSVDIPTYRMRSLFLVGDGSDRNPFPVFVPFPRLDRFTKALAEVKRRVVDAWFVLRYGWEAV